MTPEVVPPRVPSFNWIDLGLPSGTLWLDRMVGAPSPTEAGRFYQWGDTIGHSLAEGYQFNSNNYNEKGLNLISSDLDDAHDAARAYYGPEAKIPSKSQMEELSSNCIISYQGDGVYLITSKINGHSLKIHGSGFILDLEQNYPRTIRAWSNGHDSDVLALSLNIDANSATVSANARYTGRNVMAVHS